MQFNSGSILKYIGVALQLSLSGLEKGNWSNHQGIYIGTAKGSGVYVKVNGQETQISKTDLKNGDVIGLLLD